MLSEAFHHAQEELSLGWLLRGLDMALSAPSSCSFKSWDGGFGDVFGWQTSCCIQLSSCSSAHGSLETRGELKEPTSICLSG